jgi:hypothetical protein
VSIAMRRRAADGDELTDIDRGEDSETSAEATVTEADLSVGRPPGTAEALEADRFAHAPVKEASGGTTPSPLAIGLAQALGGGSAEPPPGNDRRAVESATGRPVDARVHRGPAVDVALSSWDARAAAVGRDVLMPDSYRTTSAMMRHELTHVVQSGGRDVDLSRPVSMGDRAAPEETGVVPGSGGPQVVRRQPPTGGVTVTLVGGSDSLARYSALPSALGVERWGAINDATRLRESRQAARRGGPVAPPATSPLATAARATVRVPLARLLQPRPYTEAGAFRGLLFDALRASPLGAIGRSVAIRDEIARRWASTHEAIVRGDVEVSLVDPLGALETPSELLFSVGGQPVATIDGQLWISDVDNAVSVGALGGVVQEVTNEANEVGQAASLASEVDQLIAIANETRGRSHEDVSANAAESLRTMLDDYRGRLRTFSTEHALSSQLLGATSTSLGTAAGDYQGWLEAHRRIIAAAQPEKNVWEQEVERTGQLMRMQEKAPWWAKGYIGQSVEASALSHGVPDLLSGGAVSADVQLRQAFRRGDVSIRGFREGESAIRRRGIIVGAVNTAVFLATLGLGAAIAPTTLLGQVAFGGITSALGTGIVLTTQTAVTHGTTLSDPVAQQVWGAGAQSPGDIARASLAAGVFGAGMAGLAGWLGRGPTAAVGRQLVAESLQNPQLVRTLGPGITARAVGPGVVEVVQTGQPGVVRFTVEGWEAHLTGAAGQQAVSGRWVTPSVGASGTDVTGAFRGMAAFQQPGAAPFGVAVGEQGWVVLGPGRATVGSGAWGATPGAGLGGAASSAVGPPSLLLAPAAGGAQIGPLALPRPITGLPGAASLPVGTAALPPLLALPAALAPGAGMPSAQSAAAPSALGPLFVDIQGGPALRPDTGGPTFLPSLVGQTPGARGFLLEPADYIPGYAGITATSARDLAMARLLAQQLPVWPSGTPGVPAAQPAPWLWDPRLSFPTQGPVQVLTTPSAPGATPVPQAYFPPLGGDVAPGVPRLIPVATAGRTAQQDVTRLQPSTHPELHGQVDRAYWRRPFALAAADPATTAAMGQEVGRWLKPGGFLELRLLRGGEEAQARAIAAQIPDSRIVSVPRWAIAAYARTGQRPRGLTNEQWAVLQEAAPDIRGEFGALGQGSFARIVRIYRGGPAPQRVLVVGAERPDEFDWAAGLQAAGQDVTVVNPATTPAARQFRQGGGNLVTGTVESLAADAQFNTIREDFPFPLGRVFQPTRAFAEARISRLAPGGRWFVATESRDFAATLEAVVADLGVDVVRTTPPLGHEATPTSPWLPETARERILLIFTRRRQ